MVRLVRYHREIGNPGLCMSSPIRDICLGRDVGTVTAELTGNYFDLSTFDDGESVEYKLPYGAWIRLFRSNRLCVEDLVELQTPRGATASYEDFVPASWAQHWPAEHIWKLRKIA